MNCPLLFLLLIILGGCKSKTDDATITATLNPGCYEFSNDRNSVYFHITDTADGINGYLKYNIEDRKNIIGIFNGNISGDTLSGVYSFNAGNTLQQRELLFLIKDDQLFESYGDILKEDNYTFYKDYNNLKLVETMPLTRTDCVDNNGCLTAFGQVPSKLKDCIVLSTMVKLQPVTNERNQNNEGAYLLFSDDKDRAEIFLPPYKEGIVLVKESNNDEGSWINAGYKLFAWQGYVLQKDEVPVYSGE